MPHTGKQFWKVSELARRWSVNTMTVQKWIRCGVLRAYRFPGVHARGMYRVKTTDVEQFEREHLRPN